MTVSGGNDEDMDSERMRYCEGKPESYVVVARYERMWR